MTKWPEFVTDGDEAPRPQAPLAELTGWETVVFELGDAQEDGSSDFSTAALAP